jgi:hypothetical protein
MNERPTLTILAEDGEPLYQIQPDNPTPDFAFIAVRCNRNGYWSPWEARGFFFHRTPDELANWIIANVRKGEQL